MSTLGQFTFTNKTMTTDVPINGETRPVEFKLLVRNDGKVSTHWELPKLGAAFIGGGKKLHRAGIGLVFFSTVEEARRYVQAKNIREQDGLVFAVKLTTVVRNSEARIVDWADKYEGSDFATKQTYYGSI